MEIKYTPAPWQREGNTVSYVGRGARIVAECGQSTNHETDQANAQLISAAPEMLEVLKDALVLLNALNANKENSHYRAVVDVIAKAEGKPTEEQKAALTEKFDELVKE